MSMQNAHPLICDTRSLMSSWSDASSPLPFTAACNPYIAFTAACPAFG